MPHKTRYRTKIVKPKTRQVQKYITDPKFVARMAKIKSIPIITKYDIPYIGGYSMDGLKVYIDRHLPPTFMGKDIRPLLRVHEVAEKALIDIFDIDYQQAHHIATSLEKQAVHKAGINWDHYQDYLKPYIKMISKEDLQIVPIDLDMKPYEDEHDNRLLSNIMAKKKQETYRKIKENTLQETKISLEYHDTLNTKLWNGKQLKPELRDKLMQFGNAWAEFAKIPKDLVLDITMTGGNANYNYTPQSDIDVHLIIDRSKLNPDREFVDEYLQNKKVLWTLTHKIKILGYDVEPYAQDNEGRYPQNQGVYSLLNDRWIQYPKRANVDFRNNPDLKKEILFYIKMIKQIINSDMGADAVRQLKKKIRDMRGEAIAKSGEYSLENLVFKELRNRGWLEKMNRYELDLKDKELSL